MAGVAGDDVHGGRRLFTVDRRSAAQVLVVRHLISVVDVVDVVDDGGRKAGVS